jgi:hypothetical protein
MRSGSLTCTPVRFNFIKNPFVENPGIKVREQRKVVLPDGLTSTKDIFSQISQIQASGGLNYDRACRLLNDLAYVLIPFDKSSPEFLNLCDSTRNLLMAQSGPTKLFDLVEALYRLNIQPSQTGSKSLTTVLRDKILSGHYSREARDIAICLAYFARLICK